MFLKAGICVFESGYICFLMRVYAYVPVTWLVMDLVNKPNKDLKKAEVF